MQPPGLSFTPDTSLCIRTGKGGWGLTDALYVGIQIYAMCCFALLFVALWPRYWDTSEEVQEDPLLSTCSPEIRDHLLRKSVQLWAEGLHCKRLQSPLGDIQRTKSFHCIPLILPWCDFLSEIITQGSPVGSWSPFSCSAPFSSWMKIWGPYSLCTALLIHSEGPPFLEMLPRNLQVPQADHWQNQPRQALSLWAVMGSVLNVINTVFYIV